MKDAIQAMMETQESSRSKVQQQPGNNMSADYVRGPPRKYEKIIEKLESDVRGHIRVCNSYRLSVYH